MEKENNENSESSNKEQLFNYFGSDESSIPFEPDLSLGESESLKNKIDKLDEFLKEKQVNKSKNYRERVRTVLDGLKKENTELTKELNKKDYEIFSEFSKEYLKSMTELNDVNHQNYKEIRNKFDVDLLPILRKKEISIHETGHENLAEKYFSRNNHL